MQSRLVTMVTWKSTPTSSPSKAAIAPPSVRRAGVAAEHFQGTPATPSQDPSRSTRQSLESQQSEENPSYTESAGSSVPSFTSADALEYAAADSDSDFVEGEEAISPARWGTCTSGAYQAGLMDPPGKPPSCSRGSPLWMPLALRAGSTMARLSTAMGLSIRGVQEASASWGMGLQWLPRSLTP
jgi:hypothetical protein